MKVQSFIVLGGLVIILVGAWFLAQPKTPQERSSKPHVAATIFPLYDLVRNIAGDAVVVDLILKPGASPHTFEPTPQLVQNTQEAQIVFAIGYGLDDWVLDLVADLSVIVQVDNGITLRQSTEPFFEAAEEGEVEDEHGPTDPHYWLTAKNARLISQTIASSLKQTFPDLATEFDANLSTYTSQLEGLDKNIKETLRSVGNKKLITFHDAWYYFAEAYGLTIVGTFEPTVGREPTPKYLANLSKVIEETGVRVLYAEPQFSSAGMRAFLSDQNITIATIDPEGAKNSTSYIDLMTQNALTIAQNQ